MRVPRILAGMTIAALIVLPILGLALRWYARTVIFPGSPFGFPPDASLVRYTSKDGVALAAAFIRSGRADAPVVVYFHGNAESAGQNLPLARELAARGIDTLLPEYRGYGGLPGSPSEAGLCADGEAALEALARAGVPPERTVLVGRSLGTGLAMELACRRPYRRVLLISPYTSLVDLGRPIVGPLAPLLVPDRFDSLAKAARLSCPLTVVHGTRDGVIPFAMGERLAGAVRGARFVPVEGAGHNDIPDVAGTIASEVEAGLTGSGSR